MAFIADKHKKCKRCNVRAVEIEKDTHCAACKWILEEEKKIRKSWLSFKVLMEAITLRRP